MEDQQGLSDFDLGDRFEFDQFQAAYLFAVDLGGGISLAVAIPPIVLAPDNHAMLPRDVGVVAEVDVIGRAAPDGDGFARQGVRLFDVPAPHGDVHQLRAEVDVIRCVEQLHNAPPPDHTI